MAPKALPLVNERALIVSEAGSKTLVIADLHIGLEHELSKYGIRVPSATPNMLLRVEALIKQVKPSRLLILGDLKHSFAWTPYGEELALNDFIRPLKKLVKLEIVPGNHDGNIGKLLPDTKLYSSKGFLRDRVGYFHGHAWPGEKLLTADILVCAHVHPNVSITGMLGSRHTEPCWLRAGLLSKQLRSRYKKAKINKKAEVIVMPAFNPLLGGLPVNKHLKKLPSGYRLAFNKCIDFPDSEVFLMDGTNLGKMKGIK